MSDKKNILLVSSAFYPEISPRSFRATELAKEFFRQGHSVTVITKHRDADYSDLLNEYPFQFKMWKKVSFPSVPQFESKPLSIISAVLTRLLLMFFEYPGIEEMFRVRKMLKTEKDYDLMISFAVPYPVHWGVAWSRKKSHRISKTWVADCGDPYMGDVLDSFRKLFYFSFLEKAFFRKADAVAIPVESAIDSYYKQFHDKIKIIPQGFDFDINKPKSEVNNKVPQFAYAGGFLKGIRDPELLLSFLSKIAKPFVFHVFTNQPELLLPYKERLKDKLNIRAYIPRSELMEVLGKMDFLINFDNNTTRNVPSKLIDYAITGRPVLNIDKNFQFNCIEKFIEQDYSNKLKLPDINNYHISNISRSFLDIM
ncbi:glycosyltransferase [Carboxylicivirga sp. N1Y90]|uniref:glycosyltransferase n=1 Tax=Carboxylicivirga fragile TaxID=3417571 RepID=UPI003D3556ED|nr:glycosyltransferase [Marinilabiliaceae bacterium N1Y90]